MYFHSIKLEDVYCCIARKSSFQTCWNGYHKGMKLTQEEIRNRLQKLRNYEKMYPRLQSRCVKLERQVKLLKKEIKKKDKIIKQQGEMIKVQSEMLELFKLRVEDLEKKVFGKKRKKNKDDGPKNPPMQRSKSSYRRKTPSDDEVTNTLYFKIKCCPKCDGKLSGVKDVVRYTEDVEVLSKLHEQLRKIEKQIIETGYCKICNKRVAARSLAKHSVILGRNVRQLVVYSNTVLRLSYSQIQSLVGDLVGIPVSNGEITNILEKESKRLTPCHEALKKSIGKQSGAHYDETSWKTQEEGQGNYAWVMAGTENTDAVFQLGRSRGKGNAENLKGGNDRQVGITDDYPAYKNLFDEHQLCWSHPFRKFRDLKNSEHFEGIKQQRCEKTYRDFGKLYKDLDKILAGPFDLEDRKKIKPKLMKRFEEILKAKRGDPKKLEKLKASVLEDIDCYFVCVLKEGIPADNNKAERALRHLVIKRKISFGSKTQKGADAMSVLYSVLMSLWWRKPKNFFLEYEKLTSPV
jgi:transposase